MDSTIDYRQRLEDERINAYIKAYEAHGQEEALRIYNEKKPKQ